MKTIGVTGISGSGTSTVAQLLKELGSGYIISADKLAHEAMLQGKAAFDPIIQSFGVEILGGDGEIDRKLLSARVFGRPEVLKLLEDIIHPKVWEATQAYLEALKELGTFPFAVIDAPLLIESGMHTLCETVILVTASDTVRAQRIMWRDNLTEEAAVRRLASRVGDESLKPYAQVIIENDGGVEDLREKVLAVLNP
ncbi:MAG: dephospho-CoA kinase [Defluviitaleaceae bacterium]|nr:dephospho-CoA kinase [Defluviitaleaceae bacterium]MCL2240773.1 dephospho-CoA kinase [Defluviitaleaceae bacterium]